MTKIIHAVVDRISEGKVAVILAEEINKEFIINLDDIDLILREGLWLDLRINKEEEITSITPNEGLTKKKQAKVSGMMEQLRKRKGSKFKRKK